jgi:hypothetical protein
MHWTVTSTGAGWLTVTTALLQMGTHMLFPVTGDVLSSGRTEALTNACAQWLHKMHEGYLERSGWNDAGAS